MCVNYSKYKMQDYVYKRHAIYIYIYIIYIYIYIYIYTPVDPFTWTSKDRMTTTNLYKKNSVPIQDVAWKTFRER